MEAIRGLEAQIHLSKSRIYEAIGLHELAEDERCEAHIDAYSDGYIDFDRGEELTPKLYLNEPFLLNFYNDGFNTAAELAEMSLCPGCNNGTGDPCVTHG